jgi:hypothetical protein
VAIVEFSNVSDLKRQKVGGGFPQPMRLQMEQKMPSVSKSQFRFMQGVKHGTIHAKGLSPEKAAEFTEGSPKGLPEKVKPRRHKVSFPRPDGKK